MHAEYGDTCCCSDNTTATDRDHESEKRALAPPVTTSHECCKSGRPVATDSVEPRLNEVSPRILRYNSKGGPPWT
jgi:hypothetical protein